MFCRMCSFIFLHKSQKPQMISLGMYRAAIICLSTKVRWTYRVGSKKYLYFRYDFDVLVQSDLEIVFSTLFRVFMNNAFLMSLWTLLDFNHKCVRV